MRSFFNRLAQTGALCFTAGTLAGLMVHPKYVAFSLAGLLCCGIVYWFTTPTGAEEWNSYLERLQRQPEHSIGSKTMSYVPAEANAAAPLAPGYYWYQQKPGSKPILVQIQADEVYSTEWGEFRYLPCGEAVDPPHLTSYATGVYAGPVTVPEDLSSCGLPIVTVPAGPAMRSS